LIVDCLLIVDRRVILLAAILASACGSGFTAVQKPAVVEWRRVGSWSGRGTVQTETFTSDTGGFRVHWETRNETKPGAGTLKVVFRSGDSGRDIVDAVDMRGVGRGTAEVSAERPRWYYLGIESANLEWTVTVEEPIIGVARE
jgi:ABC-type glycerol-3-phosphate transport system substrate-binding protein